MAAAAQLPLRRAAPRCGDGGGGEPPAAASLRARHARACRLASAGREAEASAQLRGLLADDAANARVLTTLARLEAGAGQRRRVAARLRLVAAAQSAREQVRVWSAAAQRVGGCT